MELDEVMKKAWEMCKDFPVCSDCPIYCPGLSCVTMLLARSEKAEKAIIDYFRRKENASK